MDKLLKTAIAELRQKEVQGSGNNPAIVGYARSWLLVGTKCRHLSPARRYRHLLAGQSRFLGRSCRDLSGVLV